MFAKRNEERRVRAAWNSCTILYSRTFELSFTENFTEEEITWVGSVRNCVLNFKPRGNAYRNGKDRSINHNGPRFWYSLDEEEKSRKIVVLMLARLVPVLIASRRYLKNW